MKGYRNRNGVTTNRQRLLKHLGREYRPRVMSEPEKAWLAAMIDGEGSISLILHRRKGTGRTYVFPVVTVNNTDVRLINRCVEIVGEHLRIQKRDRSAIRCKLMMTVHLNRVSMADVLEAVRPYLIAKGEQADLVIGFCRTHDDLPCKTPPLDQFYEAQKRCMALNKRGL